MKKPLLFIFALCFISFSYAQITLNSGNAPVVGTTYFTITDSLGGTAVMTNSSSQSQNWDYSQSFATQKVENTNFLTSVGTTYANTYPNSTLTLESSSEFSYLYANSNGFWLDGATNGSIYIDYNTEDYLICPLNNFTYASVVENNTSNTTYIGQSYKFVSTIKRTFEGDAFGSLSTPTGSYNNTLRIKVTHISIDSTQYYLMGSWMEVGDPTPDTTVSYMWVENDNPRTLLELVVNKSGDVTNAQWTSTEDPTIINEKEQNSFKIYPNPIKESIINIDFENESTSRNICIYNSIGSKVYESNANSKSIKINNNFNSGIYFYIISEKNSSKTGKLIVE